jgi:DNA-binding NarL/FixJ family response regulator
MTACAGVVPIRTRVAIADALSLFREVLRLALEANGGFSVVGENGVEAVTLLGEERPQVLLLCGATPGLQALRQLQNSGTGVPIVFLAGEMTAVEVVDAFTLGARGALFQDTSLSVLCESLKAVAEGAYWMGNERATDVVDALDRVRERSLPATAGALTTRELQVIAAVVDGATNRDIALRLNVSADTVKRLVREVFGKVGVSCRFQLAMYTARTLLRDDSCTARTTAFRHAPSPYCEPTIH